MVPAVSIGISPVPTYSGSHPLMITYPYGTLTPYGLLSQVIQVHYHYITVVLQPQNSRNCLGLGSSTFARRYLRNHYCFLFLGVLRCFSSPRSPPILKNRIVSLQDTGLPHSDTCGSTRICQSPQLIAAYHVLLRL